MQYIERCLASQQISFTRFGMYEDPNAPLAYDAFPRLWLEDAMADGAYHGELESVESTNGCTWRPFNASMVSPSGEWPCGGRSAKHQWNEAETALICEIEATNWKHGQKRCRRIA